MGEQGLSLGRLPQRSVAYPELRNFTYFSGCIQGQFSLLLFSVYP
jgi:hypothetical protein